MKKSIALLWVVSSFLLAGTATAQSLIWEQKLDILYSCTPEAAGASIIALAGAEDGTIYAADPTYLHRSFDDGENWEILAFDYSPITGIVPLSAGSLLVGIYGRSLDKSGIYRVDSHGDSWEITDINERIEFMTARPDLSVVYAGGSSSGLFVSTDHGGSWTEVLAGTRIERFTAGAYGVDYLTPGVLVSTDGLVWEAAIDSRRLLYSTSNPNVFLNARSDGIYRSDTFIADWDRVLETPRGMLLTSPTGDIYSVASSGVAYVSPDDGLTWEMFAGPIPESCGKLNIASLDFSGHIWSGTPNGALFRTSESTFVLSDERPENPVASPALEVFPNPASGPIGISFTKPSPGYSRLAIYDVLGREVHMLHSGFLAAGEHSFRWDDANLPSGYYLVNHISETSSQHAVFIRVSR